MGPLRPKMPEAGNDEPIRIQKLLSMHGRGSRREVDDLIASGRVMVNDQVAKLGDRASAADRILVDGKPIHLAAGTPEQAVLLYHKPAGEIVSHDDPEGRPSIFANLPRPRSGRWIPVGRLDFNTSGLLLLTTWGDLAARLTHPSHEVEREYAVRVLGELTPEQRAQLTAGVQLEDGMAQFDQLEEAGGDGINRWYSVTLREGRNREVRRMVEAVGLVVSRLIRVRFGTIVLPRDLPRGRARLATPAELQALASAVGLQAEAPRQGPPRAAAGRRGAAKPERRLGTGAAPRSERGPGRAAPDLPARSAPDRRAGGGAFSGRRTGAASRGKSGAGGSGRS